MVSGSVQSNVDLEESDLRREVADQNRISFCVVGSCCGKTGSIRRNLEKNRICNMRSAQIASEPALSRCKCSPNP